MLRRFVILLAVGAAIALVLLPWVAVAQNYVVDDTATTTIPENSFGPARMSTNKVLYGMPATSSGTALYPSAFASADAIAHHQGARLLRSGGRVRR